MEVKLNEPPIRIELRDVSFEKGAVDQMVIIDTTQHTVIELPGEAVARLYFVLNRIYQNRS